MIDGVVHVLDTPETVLRLAQRDVDDQKSRVDYSQLPPSERLTFRDALLSRLAEMRYGEG